MKSPNLLPALQRVKHRALRAALSSFLIVAFCCSSVVAHAEGPESGALADAAVADAKALTQEPTSHESASSDSAISELELQSLGVWPYQPWRSMKEGAKFSFDAQNRWTLLGGGAALLGAKALDQEAKDYFDHKERLGKLDKLGNDVLGTGVPGVLIGAGFWLYGDLTGRWYEAHAGQAQLEALLVTGLLSAALKGVVNRERPDQSDHFSFPSAHTSTVFASAMVLQEFYGWKAGVPAFMLGALTAASRMSEGKHWLSDTVGGALVGILVGHAFSRAHLERFNAIQKDSKRKTAKITVYPAFEEGGGKLVFKATF